ncbi:transposon Tf2-6 polyprotein [Trichonephila clavipes]|nr:transposon Tf2-6 polyprotein [Trichonephila clavipes]
MQVYEAEVEDEIVVQHVTNPRIRRELFELISNYEPKKTEMTNVSMRIILKDDIPVYQSGCHLAFSENQDVNKQIDEWLEQGIRTHAERRCNNLHGRLIIPAKDEKEDLEKLREVLDVTSKYGLEMKFNKCQFLRRKVKFLGHVVENGTIRPSIAKTITVKKFPVPKTVKKVQSFFGLTG